MELPARLELAAMRAAPYGPVLAVLPAEPAGGECVYLLALGEQDAPSWLVLDGAFEPVTRRETVRQVAGMVVLCELAAELAGGGSLSELQERLAELDGARPGAELEAARVAAAELAEQIGVPPVVASAAYLDRVGAAAVRLERTLGERSSPLAAALAAQSHTVEAFVQDVLERYGTSLR